jgi:TRAP-type C4-dicarboxylate transport system permease small subunit
MFLCELLVVCMIVIVTAEVVSRSLFNFSFQVTHEIAGYFLVGVTFLGISISLRDHALFRVEFIYMRIPARSRAALQLMFNLLSLVFVVILDYQLIRLVISSYTRGVIEPTILATPLYIPQLVMPIGVFMIVMVLLVHILEDCRTLFRIDNTSIGKE